MCIRDRPVTVRLLDPPLHEFLPKTKEEIVSVANSLDISYKEVDQRIQELHEQNPMLGHRGCRLAISFPEIYEMQCKAIFEALVECKKNEIKSIIGNEFYYSDQSDSWSITNISGDNTINALERICPLNLAIDSFKVNDAHRTSMEHIGVIILRINKYFYIAN